MNITKTLYVTNRHEWRAWLAENHTGETEVWLIFYKKHTGQACIPYEEAVEEALCFGWIDSIIQKMDAERYAQKFTPRKNSVKWSESNKKRLRKMIAEGKMTPAGLAKVGPGTLDEPDPDAEPKSPAAAVPAYLSNALCAHPLAWENFKNLAPSYRKQYINWIAEAKREETRNKRIAEAIELLKRNQKLGMK